MLQWRLSRAIVLLFATSCGSNDDGLFGAESDASGGSSGTAADASAGAAGAAAGAGTAGADASDDGGTDGAAPDAEPDASCAALEWCRDVDGDGFGDPGTLVVACDPPGAGWLVADQATPCSDCFDQSADIHPGSTQCIVKGYGPSHSFDANCDGEETECGPKAGQCGGVLCGQGAGYLPKGSSTINPYCGSTAYRVCNGTGTICSASEIEKPSEPMPCL